MVENLWYHVRNRMTLYIGPLIAATVILIDWNHTREWKKNGRKSVLDKFLRDEDDASDDYSLIVFCEHVTMGTFTITYFLRKAVWDHKYMWAAVPFIYYFGKCWDAAGYHKVQMMKGHSKMYASRIAAIPAGEDVWRY